MESMNVMVQMKISIYILNPPSVNKHTHLHTHIYINIIKIIICHLYVMSSCWWIKYCFLFLFFMDLKMAIHQFYTSVLLVMRKMYINIYIIYIYIYIYIYIVCGLTISDHIWSYGVWTLSNTREVKSLLIRLFNVIFHLHQFPNFMGGQ